MKPFLWAVIWGIVALTSGVLAAVAYPEPFFPHSRQFENVSFHAVQPIPASADVVLKEISARLKASGMQQDNEPLKLFIADTGWRNQLYFGLVRGAGGVVYYPLTHRHAFLSGADFEKGLLRKRARLIAPPRDLAYFGTHELAHVLTGREVGAIRYHKLPEWVREGLADYIALGAPDIATLDAELRDNDIMLANMVAHGSYPRKRMLVAYFLEVDGWSLDELLQTSMTQDDALKDMRQAR